MVTAGSANRILDWLEEIQIYHPQSTQHRKMITAKCRGAPLDKLPLVLRYGVDSDTPSIPFNVGELYKASEYTSNPGLILFYDDEKLDPTFREVAADIDPRELAELARTFTTKLVSEDGKFFWLSRFPAGHPQLRSPYEFHYARWIPGDPLEALLCIWIIGPPDEILRDRCLAILETAEHG